MDFFLRNFNQPFHHYKRNLFIINIDTIGKRDVADIFFLEIEKFFGEKIMKISTVKMSK